MFENYLRVILRRTLLVHGLEVLDGNLREPAGVARPLFDPETPAVKRILASPDVVIRRRGTPSTAELVIDAKYKPPNGKPARIGIDQVLVYSLVYNCGRVALAYPGRKPGEPVFQSIGSIGGIEISRLLIDLGTNDLPNEETNVANAIGRILSTPALRDSNAQSD